MARVLIIEDNQRVADILSSFLVKKGLESDIVTDGISAMRSFVGQAYDLLLVNLELPFMNGDALCRKIRETAKGKDVPIIMMSGALKVEAEIDRLKQEIGLTGFLTKPFTSDILTELLSSVLQDRLSKDTAAPSAQTSPAAHPRSASLSKQPQALKGNLETTPFEKVFLYLLKKRGTGTLTVTREAFKRIFFFIDGGPVELETTGEEDDFGYYLNRKKLVDEVELREYRERRKRDNGDPRDIFVKMGCLTLKRFREESEIFLQDRLVDCFSWKTGTVLFEWAASLVPSFPAATASMPALFYRGFTSTLNADRISFFLEEKGSLFVGRTRDFYEYQNLLVEELADAEMLDSINGLKTCLEVTSSIDTEDAGILLYTLDYLKALSYTETPGRVELQPPFTLRERLERRTTEEPESFEDLGGALSSLEDEVAALQTINPAPAAATAASNEGLSGLEEDLKKQWEAVKDRNYYEIFGMNQNAFSFDKLKKTYFEYTRSYGPDKFFASPSEIMALAEEFLSKISNAYETLSNVVSKENYDEMLASQDHAPSDGRTRSSTSRSSSSRARCSLSRANMTALKRPLRIV